MPTPSPVVLTGSDLTLEDVRRVARDGARVEVAEAARVQVRAARAFVEELAGRDEPTYGVNTGFGTLAEVRIDKDKLDELQMNLLVSHAAGVGEPLPAEVVRALMVCRANVLSGGRSGVREETLDLLVAVLNAGIVPVVPSRGSVGASGDLAPLAHLALVLVGRGEAFVDGARVPGLEALSRKGLLPIVPRAKEGLALVNGTQAMLAVGTLALLDAEDLLRVADVAGALTIEGLLGSHRPFLPEVHAARTHPGQGASAAFVKRLVTGSEINASHQHHCDKVQDPYSLRCLPQVHGAARDAVGFVRGVLEHELNAATDNPLLFPETHEVVSAGNFHGQPLSQALDFLAIAIQQLATISERRIEQLVNPALSHLPPFLTRDSGLHSGFMIAQVTAAALVTENKGLCHPACVDTIPSSAGREDHVSMGMTAAHKARAVVDNVATVLAIELLVAAQALEFRRPLRSGPGVEAAHASLRAVVPAMDRDRELHKDISASLTLVRSGRLLEAVDGALAS